MTSQHLRELQLEFISASHEAREKLLEQNPLHSLRKVARGGDLNPIAEGSIRTALNIGLVSGEEGDRETAFFLYRILCYKAALIYRSECIKAKKYLTVDTCVNHTSWIDQEYIFSAIESRQAMERIFPTVDFEHRPNGLDIKIKTCFTIQTNETETKALLAAYFLLSGKRPHLRGADVLTFIADQTSGLNESTLHDALSELLDEQNKYIDDVLSIEVLNNSLASNNSLQTT